jgi:hypothetical protein
MAEAREGSDHLREEDAQHTPPACVREMDQASAGTGSDQKAPHASGGEGVGEPETGVELPEGSQKLHDPQGTPRGCYGGVLDAGDSYGAQAVTGSWSRRITKRGRPLWRRPRSSKEWRSCLCRAVWNGRGGAPKPHRLHPRNTSDPPGRRDVRGSFEPGDPTISDACEVQERGPSPMEDRERMVLRIP